MHLIPSSVARQRAGLAFAVGLIIGAGALAAVLHHTRVEPEVDWRMQAGCVMPRAEGESTFAVIYKGEFVCWRNQ